MGLNIGFVSTRFAGIDGVSMAANHIKDYGEEGIIQTIDILTHKKIGYFGAGVDFSSAQTPWITEVNGVRMGFLGYNDVVPVSYKATENSAGSAWADIEEIREAAKSKGKLEDIFLKLTAEA